MGQKTHPNGFRLVTTQKHLSEWYTTKLNYSSLIEEDYFIRKKVDDFFNENLSISKVEINRILQDDKLNEYVNINIYALFPRAKEMSRKITKSFLSIIEKNSSLNDQSESSNDSLKNIGLLTTIKDNLKVFTSFVIKRTIRNFIRFLQLKTKKNYFIKITFIKNQFEDSVLIAKFISDQLEKRTPFRRAVKKAIKKVQLTTIQGIKIELSGRLNGIDIARSEWKRDGKIPLHTLKANIDYTYQTAQTIYGVIGIKIWLFKENK